MQTIDLVQADPTTLVVGANIRTDTRPDAKEFAASIRARGVLEPIVAYRDDDGALVVLLGQRRALVAARVGTPTGTVPVVVVERPETVDRVADQLVENVHREAISDRELCAAVDQLAMVGVSAAQITKRTGLDRATVDTALAVSRSQDAARRLDSEGLSLADAAIFAEFADDAEATGRLEDAARWGRPLVHVAQRLRDEAAERARLAGEVERLRAQGLPVLDAAEVPSQWHRLRLSGLVDDDGGALPEAEWPQVPGAAVVLHREWVWADHDADTDDENDADADVEDEDGQWVVTPVWVCLDPDGAGLRSRSGARFTVIDGGGADGDDGDAQREARRAERALVVANNRAWRSAETVRREWLRGFFARRIAPKGAEALIAAAVLHDHGGLSRAMGERHALLRELLGTATGSAWDGAGAALQILLDKAGTPKAQTMLTMAAVLAAWEAGSGVHTWRTPDPWTARVLTTLAEWGYPLSDIEQQTVTAATRDDSVA